MKITLNDEEFVGTPKEIIKHIRENLSSKEQREFIEALKNKELDMSGISDEEANEMLKEMSGDISIKDMLNVFNNEERPKDTFKKLPDGKVEIPVNLGEESEKKFKHMLKKDDKTSEKAVEEYIAKENRRHENMDYTEIEAMYQMFNIPENDRLKNFQVVKTLLNNSYRRVLDDMEIGNEEQKKQATREFSTYKHFINPVLNNLKLFELDDEVVPMLTLQDFDEQKSPFPSIGIDCRVWLERNGVKNFYFGFLLGSYYTEDNIHYRAVTTVYATKNSDGEYRLEKDLFILGKKYCKELTGHTGEKEYGKLRKFIYSFLNYINSPEIIIKDFPHNPKNNERRKKKGRVELPPLSKIHIHGTLLRKYINDVNQGIRTFGYSHRFWVRGHYEHFWNRKKYNQIYKLNKEQLEKKGYHITPDGIIRKWKKAFIKGQGLMLEKEYKVEK